MTNETKSCREVLPVHSAADLFQMMSLDKIDGARRVIKAQGLHYRVVIVHHAYRWLVGIVPA